MEEDDAEVGGLVLGLGHVAAVHVRVAARLVDQQAANFVQALGREAPLFENRPTLERRHTAGDYAERLTGGVIVDRLDRA